MGDVVAHAGAGIALSALHHGTLPVLVPRRPDHGEHVDDHQLQIAGSLAEQSLATSVEADQLQWSDIVDAASSSIVQQDSLRPFELDESDGAIRRAHRRRPSMLGRLEPMRPLPGASDGTPSDVVGMPRGSRSAPAGSEHPQQAPVDQEEEEDPGGVELEHDVTLPSTHQPGRDQAETV